MSSTSNTQFYDRYLLTNNINNTPDRSILKKFATLNYTDYEKLKISEQYNKLYNKIYEVNKQNVESHENKKIYNLSIYQLLQNSIQVYIDILHDLSIFFSDDNKEKSINKLGYIFIKNDNLLYVGILILFISFLLWLIDITK